MEALTLAVVGILSLTCANAIAQSATNDSLFAQSAQAALSRFTAETDASSRFATSSRISWLLFNTQDGQLLASKWPQADHPIPIGSLTKPFVALAYARTHTSFPLYHCSGAATRCWLPKGHGTLALESALAYSCNAYFLQLARETSLSAMNQVGIEYGLPALPAAATPDEEIGLVSTWRIAPLALGRAYVRLALNPILSNDLIQLRNGMRLAALHGTASALAKEDALAKTGTAPCVQGCSANGDGFVVALTPSENPHLLLLVRERGATGAATAVEAARMLHTLRSQHVIAN
jgi:hypothetical protein